MSESKHTPGPWQLSRNIVSPGIINGLWTEEGDHVASFTDFMKPEFRITEANARLIAAAPELLAACKEVEWSAELVGTRLGWPQCPCCLGIKYDHWPQDDAQFDIKTDFHAARRPFVGHHADCQLSAAIRAAEGE